MDLHPQRDNSTKRNFMSMEEICQMVRESRIDELRVSVTWQDGLAVVRYRLVQPGAWRHCLFMVDPGRVIRLARRIGRDEAILVTISEYGKPGRAGHRHLIH